MGLLPLTDSRSMKRHIEHTVHEDCKHKPKLNYLGAKFNPAVCVNCGMNIKKDSSSE